jgi:CBS domain-containing protein/mannitol/fructose-specific phosphotransferase system IIA component (Ntr-type)
MRLLDLLPDAHVIAPLQARSVADAVRELLAVLQRAGAIVDSRPLDELLVGAGAPEIVAAGHAALPHLRTDAVKRLTVALGAAPTPLSGASGVSEEDGGPRIVALILAPTQQPTLYLQTLAALAGLFRKESVVDKVSAARSPAEVRAVPQLASLRIESKLTVRDIMIHNPQCVAADLPVRDAVDLMVRRRVRALPVVGSKGEVLGIVSESDVMREMLPRLPRGGEAERPGSDPLRVRDVMTRSVLCIAEELGLEEAANMMIHKDVDQFPVTNEGRLTGFLTRGDIIRKLFGR